jgi:hypothetical protein
MQLQIPDGLNATLVLASVLLDVRPEELAVWILTKWMEDPGVVAHLNVLKKEKK